MVREDIELLEDKKILRAAMRERNMKQTELGEKLGMLQSSVSGNLNRTRMGLDVFVKMLKALDYDVVIADHKTGETVWQVKI